jgi:hypothetical protein
VKSFKMFFGGLILFSGSVFADANDIGVSTIFTHFNNQCIERTEELGLTDRASISASYMLCMAAKYEEQGQWLVEIINKRHLPYEN